MTTTSMRSLTEIKSCEVCGSDKLVPVLDLGQHPLCDDLVAVGDNRVVREYPIEISFCPTCATGAPALPGAEGGSVSGDYHYRSRFTADVLSGMKSLVDACEQRLGLARPARRSLDIGCNDGSLLDFFARRAPAPSVSSRPARRRMPRPRATSRCSDYLHAQRPPSRSSPTHGSPTSSPSPTCSRTSRISTGVHRGAEGGCLRPTRSS